MKSIIAVIGCGNVGMRHVEALGRLRRPASIYAIDLHSEALKRACTLFEKSKQEMCGDNSIVALNSIADLPWTVDVAIIATTAHNRLAITEQLISSKNVKSIILEKFLFPCYRDYERCAEVLTALNDAAWVNCPRRIYPGYRDIAKQILESKFVDLRVTGRASVAPIGTIAIHFGDLLGFLGRQSRMNLKVAVEDPILIPTQRGVDDFAGILTASSADGRLHMQYAAVMETNAPQTVYLEADNARYVILEWCEKMYVATESSNWEFVEKPFPVPFQSRLTDLVVEEILSTGNCNLPLYTENALTHKSILDPLLNAYRQLVKNPHIDEVSFT